MAHYQAMGSIPPKRHTQHRRPAKRGKVGELYSEELMGEEGFSSDSSLLYHRNIPSHGRRVPRVDRRRPRHHGQPPAAAAPPQAATTCSPRRSSRTPTSSPAAASSSATATSGSSYAVAAKPSPWYRNGIGDECVYVERGTARVETVFGAFEVGEGDYVIIPRATTHRWIPTSSARNPLRTICIEASSHIAPPKRYLSKYGQLLEHSPYCERDLRVPQGPLLAEDVGEDPDATTEVFIKHRGGGPASSGGIVGTVHVLPFHPLDVVGWDGCLYPYVFNVRDYEPITGRIHQPPPAHQVFEGWNFVVCNFVPRKVDYHPLAIPVPYYHSNVDSDEVMFYVDGDYEARKGSGIGRARSRCTRAATRTARSRARPRPASARTTSTSSPSWSTPSARSSSARPGAPATTACTPEPGTPAAPDGSRSGPGGVGRGRATGLLSLGRVARTRDRRRSPPPVVTSLPTSPG